MTEKQQVIQQYELELQQKLASKKLELYQPILDKVQVVVDKVGKEMGYTMIFDTSMGGLVFATEADNLLSTIQAKLLGASHKNENVKKAYKILCTFFRSLLAGCFPIKIQSLRPLF